MGSSETKKLSIQRLAKLILRAAPLAYLLGWFLFFFFQRKLLYIPSQIDFKTCEEMKNQGAKPIDVVSENSHLRFYLKTDLTAQKWLIVFHGNGGSACDRAYIAEFLRRSHINIVFAEYPGYSGDTEAPSQEAILSNANHLYQFVKGTYAKSSPVFVFGESLGTGVATYVASKNEIAGLILQSPYTSISDVAAFHYPYILGIHWLVKDSFQAKDWAPKVTAPVLVFHGSVDEIVPFEIGEKESEQFKTPTRFIRIEDAGHNDIMLKNHAQEWAQIEDFIR